jgi:hypothetical protein
MRAAGFEYTEQGPTCICIRGHSCVSMRVCMIVCMLCIYACANRPLPRYARPPSREVERRDLAPSYYIAHPPSLRSTSLIGR